MYLCITITSMYFCTTITSMYTTNELMFFSFQDTATGAIAAEFAAMVAATLLDKEKPSKPDQTIIESKATETLVNGANLKDTVSKEQEVRVEPDSEYINESETTILKSNPVQSLPEELQEVKIKIEEPVILPNVVSPAVEPTVETQMNTKESERNIEETQG